ncbi:MAG: hypothetical protein GY795_49260 [Desulfobacterales bacterium]|nr:hypothetical protein [Desulfobacterales bacterium]
MGVRKIRLIVTCRIPQEKRNALWLMFSAVQEKVQYGVSNYEGKMDEMGSTINQLLIKYRAGGINMPYTVEDYRNELERNVLKSLTPEKILEKFPLDELLKKASPEDRLKGLSPEEIEAYLDKIKKKQTQCK